MKEDRVYKVAENYIGQLGSPMTFVKKDNKSSILVCCDEIEKYYTTERVKGSVAKKCYGMIISGKVNRADGIKQNVLVCAGNSTLSSYGVLLFLRKTLKSKDLLKKLISAGAEKNKKWGAMIEVENHQSRVKTKSPINPALISVDVIEIFAEEQFRQPFIYEYENIKGTADL